jgi:hypothetical protein
MGGIITKAKMKMTKKAANELLRETFAGTVIVIDFRFIRFSRFTKVFLTLILTLAIFSVSLFSIEVFHLGSSWTRCRRVADIGFFNQRTPAIRQSQQRRQERQGRNHAHGNARGHDNPQAADAPVLRYYQAPKPRDGGQSGY